MLITLCILLAASLALNLYQRGVIRGFQIDNDNHTRAWNDGYARARDFFEPQRGGTEAYETDRAIAKSASQL